MTLVATYDPILSRVQLSGSDLADGTIRVERSINQMLWMTVRGGSAVEVSSGIFTLDDYEFFDGVENFYRITESITEQFDSPAENQQFGDPWPVPPNVRTITVQAWGAGGSGQGDLPPLPQRSRSGGGGGAFARSELDVVPGENLNIRVGEGGDPLGITFSGQDGNDTTIFRESTPIISAAGGSGANGQFSVGIGGLTSNSVGDTLFGGGSGGVRSGPGGGGGGGGGSAFTDADGENGEAAENVAEGTPGLGGEGGDGTGRGGDGADKGIEDLQVLDIFDRVEANTWGTASSGQEWEEEGGAPADSSVDGENGIVTLQANPATIRYKRIPEVATDGEILCSISPDQVATGGSFFPGTLWRYVDNSNFYRCRLELNTSGEILIQVLRVSTLIGSTVNTGLTYEPDDIIWLRVNLTDQTFLGRVWLDGTDEPDTWDIEETVVTNTIPRGLFGMTISASGANTNDDPTFSVGHFEADVKQIAADVYDFFDRSESNTWGVSSSGHTWGETGGLASDRDVIGNLGIMTLSSPTTTQRFQTIDVDYADCEILTTVAVNETASGGSLAPSVLLRHVDGSNFYLARIHFTTASNVFLSVTTTAEGQIDGNQDSGFDYVPNDVFNVRVRIDGQTVRVRVWPDGDDEPGSWQIERTATSGTIASGRVGWVPHAFGGNTNDDVVMAFSKFLADPVAVLPIINQAQDGEFPGGGGGGQADIQETDNPLAPPGAGGAGAHGQLFINSWIDGEEETASVVPDLMGEVWLKSIRFPFLNRILECTPYSPITRPFRGSVHNIKGRNVPVAVVDRRGARQFTITVVTRGLEDARNFDLTLAANTIFFLHTPREDPEECERSSAVPGGYVVILDTTQTRTLPGSDVFAWDLPCQVVAAPAPDVVGTTMTWRTVERLYGSWAALVASNPTWRVLLHQVGDPDDLVVL